MEEGVACKDEVRKQSLCGRVMALAAHQTISPGWAHLEARNWVGKPGEDYSDAWYQLSLDIGLENKMG